jgi:hypothetical protein
VYSALLPSPLSSPLPSLLLSPSPISLLVSPPGPTYPVIKLYGVLYLVYYEFGVFQNKFVYFYRKSISLECWKGERVEKGKQRKMRQGGE